ncbi:MAG: pilus assembly protein PilP [Nitrospirae bacterium]|nr:pilus assembly protein PilP [Nitrospirota bacterium]
MGFQVGDIIEKLKSDRRLQMVVGGVLVLIIAGVAIFFLMPSSSEQPTTAKPAAVPMPKGKDNATAKKQPDNKTAQSDNKTIHQGKTDNKTVQSVKPDNKTAQLPPQTQQPAQYTSLGKRDPFMPLLIPKEILEKKTDKKRLSPLEDCSLADVQLTAIVKGKEGYYGLVKLPDGKSYTVRAGMLVCSSEGRVYKITQDSVIIKEKIKDERGRLIIKENPLKLRRGEE